MESREKLKKQIFDSAGNVQYTFIAHWNIVNRVKRIYFIIKLAQIILTAITTTGFVSTIIKGISWFSWASVFCSTCSLFINLYLLSFRPTEEISVHRNAANELWEIRECYKSLLVDYDDLDIEDIRSKRDTLITRTSEVNKKYPGTDEWSFSKAQKEISNYQFEDGESAELFNIDSKKSSSKSRT